MARAGKPVSPADWSATQLLAGFADRSLSPLEAWSAVETRIAALEPTLNALFAYDPERARRDAAASTERWQRGAPLGPLDGVPVTVKELVATAGDPIPKGTAASDLTPAAEDAPPVARLREDGAIIFAKTTCPDYAMLSSGVSTFHGLTRNPWNLAANPGGSSSGAAAAAAAGYGPLHLGTDIGGSIRIPAGWTGLFGLKPSHGRVPIDPYYLGRCAGPMTRSVADAALMMATLSRPDWRDGTSLPPVSIDWLSSERDIRGLRIGLMLDAGCGLSVDPEILEAVTTAARRFEAAGAIVSEVPPVMTRAMLDGLDGFWRARAWREIGALPVEAQQRILPYIHEWAAAGQHIPGVDVIAGYEQTYAMRKACGLLFREVDAVLSPTNPVVSFPAEHASPTENPARPFEHIAFTVPWNMSEQPAASIHCGFARSGMPIGMQIIGPRFDDLLVLKLAHLHEGWSDAIAWPEPDTILPPGG